jgi:hypothetical protein
MTRRWSKHVSVVIFIWVIFENLLWAFKFHLILARIVGTWFEDQYTFLDRVSLSSFWNEKCYKNSRVNQNTYFVFSNVFFFLNHAVYKIMWITNIEPDRSQMTVWRMWIAWWIPKATDTHSRICNTYCFSTAAMVTRCVSRLHLYIAYLVCYYI